MGFSIKEVSSEAEIKSTEKLEKKQFYFQYDKISNTLMPTMALVSSQGSMSLQCEALNQISDDITQE